MNETNTLHDMALRVHDAEERAAQYRALLQEVGNWKTFKDILAWRRKIKALFPDPVPQPVIPGLEEGAECPRCSLKTFVPTADVERCTSCGYSGQ